MTIRRFLLIASILIASAVAGRLGYGAERPARGAKHRPLRVAVLDTGLDVTATGLGRYLCADGHRAYNGQGIADEHGHGTHIVSTIARYAGGLSGLTAGRGYCLVIARVFGYERSDAALNRVIAAAIRDMVAGGADIINLSFGGTEYSEVEREAIARAPSVMFVAAAGNDGRELGANGYAYYPASYRLPNLRVVGAVDKSGRRSAFSNYGGLVAYWQLGSVISDTAGGGTALMHGTSMAAAIETGLLIRRLLTP